ncbi:hypothetical protein ALC53_07249 [Atta colombica]|uniref:F5/8 type C domain-containing protein n=1 Tax=Atta colombica TaxID=520822 RepID=A0A195BDG2_9HYME|nr:hypothetical protein ALC53_07249 [Atta colombica]
MRRVKWLWTVWIYRCLSPSFSLVDSPYGSPSPSSSHLLAYEALARGELHNSWLCYTPTTATPEDSLPEGLRRPNPPCTTTFYASTSLPGKQLPLGSLEVEFSTRIYQVYRSTILPRFLAKELYIIRSFSENLGVILYYANRFALTSSQAQCIAPLGMESGAIPDADITASSSFDSGNVGPHRARLFKTSTVRSCGGSDEKPKRQSHHLHGMR